MTVEESANQSSMKATLSTGYNTLDGEEKITFNKYIRFVLPVDGYVFWVKDLTAPQLIVDGSIHYSTDQEQRDDETIGINRVILTTANQIQDFNAISNNSIYIGDYAGIRFSFTANGKFYHMAGMYHYHGDAIYPVMYPQIIDNPANPVDLGLPIATNSLPIWLSMNNVMPIFPAFLVPSNLRPPYATVNIEDTTAWQASPMFDSVGAHWQLVTENVKVTIYGLRNNDALAYQDYVLQQSLLTENFGIQNIPVFFDEKRTQSELGILAIKKTIEFEINYYQNKSLAIAQQLITSAFCSVGV